MLLLKGVSIIMGFFSGIGSALSSVCSAVSSAISGLCGRIGSTVLGGAVSSMFTRLPLIIDETRIPEIVGIVAEAIGKILKVLFPEEEEMDSPEDLAMKAEKDEQKPEDFDSAQEYINHLREDIKLSKEDKERLNKMTDEERSAYSLTGTYIYTKAINEKLGLDNDWLKKTELTGLTVDNLVDAAKLFNVISPDKFIAYTKYLISNGVDMKQFSDYLNHRSENFLADEKVQDALIGAIGEQNPGITPAEVAGELNKLNIED